MSVEKLKSIFSEASAIPSAEARAAFLDQACSGNPELRMEVDAILTAQEQAGGFLESPILGPDAEEGSEFLGARIGRYRILEQIGEGGFGIVYMAEQESPVRRKVALKVIKTGMDTRQVIARFEAERQALALMEHPNIARVLDAGETTAHLDDRNPRSKIPAGLPYFVMELVNGIPITEFCDQLGLPIVERIELFIPVCQAVQHAHQKGVIHRDLKPSNVLVTVIDGRPVPKVIDFGVAKAIEQRLTERTLFTHYGQLIGTPAYMSPEQAELSGQDVDTRSDVYSLGVLLYELLTGAPPFDTKELLRSGLDGMRRTIRETEPARPSTHLHRMRRAARSQLRSDNSEIENDLDWIVMKCLEKDRARRYATANGLAADLQRHLNNEPVVARPPSAVYRFQKAFRRHRVLFIATTAVAASLIIGLVVSLSKSIEASQARQAAESAQRQLENQLYGARINLARQAWDEGNVGRVRQLLKITETHANRGLEWYFWQRQTHLEVRTLRGHRGAVVAVAYSPDGQQIVTGSFDHTARLWDANTGTVIHSLVGHSGAVRSAAFSTTGDRIGTASADGTAKIWDAATRQELFTLAGHDSALTSVAFSPDGRSLVTGSLDGTARIWDAKSGTIRTPLEGSGGGIWSVAFSGDGKWIITSSDDEIARVWDATSGALLFKLEPASARIASRESPADPIPLTAAFSPIDSRWIVTGSRDQKARVWDAASPQAPLELHAAHHWLSPRQADIPFAAVFSPDGKYLLTGSLNHTATLWSLAGRSNLVTFKGHEAEISAVGFSPDGRYVVTGSYDQTARIWEANGGTQPLVLGGHTGIVPAVAFSSDGRTMATGSVDGVLKLWEASSGKELRTLWQDAGFAFWDVAFSPDDQQIIAGCGDGMVRVWATASGRQLLAFKGHTATVRSVSFSPDSRWILSSGEDGTARVWDASRGEPHIRLQEHHAMVRAIFSPDGQRIITASEDGDRTTDEEAPITIWNAADGRRLLTLAGQTGGISTIACSVDGQRIVSGGIGRTAILWDAISGQIVHRLDGHSDQVIKVLFTRDNSRVITGCFDHTSKVWDAATGQELLTLRGPLICAVSPTGQHFVTVDDPPVMVWGIATPGQVEGWRKEEQLADKSIHALRPE